MGSTATETGPPPSSLTACAPVSFMKRMAVMTHIQLRVETDNWRRYAAAVFAADGLTCAVGGESGRIVVWDVDL